MRAQTELPAIAIAFILLTAVIVLGVGAASTTLSNADRSSLEHQEAVGLSDSLVSTHADHTVRANVVDGRALETLTVADLVATGGLSPGSDVRVTLGSETILADGDPSSGTTIDRLVLVENRTERTLEPSFARNRTVTLPRRTPTARIDIRPPPSTTVRSVSTSTRTLLHNDSGLRGSFTVTLSRYETQQLTFEAAGRLAEGDVRIVYYPATVTKATLRVTVDA